MSLPPPSPAERDTETERDEQRLFEWVHPDGQWATRAILWMGEDDDMSREMYLEAIVGVGNYRFTGECMVKVTYPAVPVLDREEVTVERLGKDPATLEVRIDGEWRKVEPGEYLTKVDRYVNQKLSMTEAGVVRTSRGRRVTRQVQELMAEGKSLDDAITIIARKDMPYDEMTDDE